MTSNIGPDMPEMKCGGTSVGMKGFQERIQSGLRDAFKS